jgi:hypothetical protein
VSTTLQALVLPEVSVAGVQLKDAMDVGAFNAKLTVLEVPCKVAVRTAVWESGTVPAVTVSEAVVAPTGTSTAAAGANSVLLPLKATTIPPAGAACESVKVQVAAPPELRTVGLQANEESVATGVSEKLTVLEVPSAVAVKIAVWESDTAPAVTVSEAVVAPTGTSTAAAGASSVLLPLKVTTVPPAGAGCDSATVQLVLPPELSAVGLHTNDDSAATGFSEKLAVLKFPFRLAVNTAVWESSTVPAVTAIEAVVAPTGTSSAAAGASSVLLALKATTIPPAGAACESATVQLVLPPELSTVGLHTNDASPATEFSEKLTVFEVPFHVAVKTAVSGSDTVPAVTVIEPVVAPAGTSSAGGGARKLLLPLRPTVVPPAGAPCESVAVHVAVPPELNTAGVQANDDSVIAGLMVKLAVAELPFKVAVKTAVWTAATAPAVTATEPVLAPAATVTKAGDVSKLLLLLRYTVVPPAGATCESPTVHALVPPELSVLGVHASDDTVVVPGPIDCVPRLPGAFNVKPLVATLPFKLAVNTAVCEVAMVPAVSLTVADVVPAATVTEAGELSSALLLLKPTVAPPVAATCASPTVQVLVPAELSDVGLQDSDANVFATKTAPPEPDKLTRFAAADAASAPATPTVMLCAFAESVNCAVAANPLPMTLPFAPLARQVYIPELAAQLRVFAAAVSADPAVTVTPETLPAGYVNVHCSPATWLELEGSLNVSPSATVPPATPDPDDSESVVCAQHVLPRASSAKSQLSGRRSAVIVHHVGGTRSRGNNLPDFGSRTGNFSFSVRMFRKIDDPSCLAARPSGEIYPFIPSYRNRSAKF